MEEFGIPDGFAEIWERVTRREEEKTAPPDKRRELESFIEREINSIAFYKALLGRCGGRDRQMLCRILADERSHLHRLQLRYFMETGDSMPVKYPKAAPMGLLSAYREASLAEAEVCRLYRRASENPGSPDELFLAIAADEERHSRLMEEAVAQLF